VNTGAFQLLSKAPFLTVNLLDRYCSKRVVYKRYCQLPGCAALLIAAKYGDKNEKVPTIKELKSMCCSLYDDDMFLQMEWHVLSTSDCTVSYPTTDSFLKIAVKDSIPDPETENLTLYILGMPLFYHDFVSKQSPKRLPLLPSPIETHSRTAPSSTGRVCIALM
jgi:Cyclin, N-terminal domain